MVATGIDVSKALLDVFVAEGPVHRFENSGSGIRCGGAFARACGCEAKTDALDARVLARNGQVFPASDPLRRRAGRHARSCNNGCAGVGNWLTSGSRNGTGWTRRLHGWTKSIRPCGSAVMPSAHKPRGTAAYRGWAP